MSPDPPIMWIRWTDSTECSGWWNTEDIRAERTVECVSVGYLLADENDTLIVAPHVHDLGGDNERATGTMLIPRAVVVEMRALNPNGEEREP